MASEIEFDSMLSFLGPSKFKSERSVSFMTFFCAGTPPVSFTFTFVTIDLGSDGLAYPRLVLYLPFIEFLKQF